MKLIIKRSKWCRGNKNLSTEGDSMLLTDEGTMCCLGFLALECGLARDEIENVSEPKELSGAAKQKWPKHTDLVSQLIIANDATRLSEVARENKIKRLMAQAGVEVIFKK